MGGGAQMEDVSKQISYERYPVYWLDQFVAVGTKRYEWESKYSFYGTVYLYCSRSINNSCLHLHIQ